MTPCARCGGPHPFDTTLPSAAWNAVIRARGLPEYLCLTCIVQEFAALGQGFTAALWGGPEGFSGLPIEVRIAPAFEYWTWAKTAPHCAGCGHAFDVENAKLTSSPDVDRWCSKACALSRRQRPAAVWQR